jgi:hypothetical protein
MKLNNLFEEQCIITESELYEMARIQKKDSGINVMIYASTKDVVKGRHGPRIKVSNIIGTFSDSDNFSVSIAHEPQIMSGKSKLGNSTVEDIFDFVKINYEALMKYWNNSYESDSDFYTELKQI